MAKILLMVPPVDPEAKFGQYADLGASTPPINLIYLGTSVERAGHTVKIIDCDNQEMNHNDVLQLIREWEPDIVGMSSVTVTIESSKLLAKQIKAHFPHITTVVGWFHMSVEPEETMHEGPEIDYGVIGEGEVTFPELVERIVNRGDPKTVKGIIYRDGEQLVMTPERDIVTNLDDMPFPNFDLLPGYTTGYRQAAFRAFLPNPFGFLLWSRGCPFKCTYCGRQMLGQTIRHNTKEYAVDMLEHLVKRYGVRSVLFGDELFLNKKSFGEDVMEEILRRGLKLQWACQSRVNTVRPGLLKLMRQAGCAQIAYGIESGSPQILQKIDKKATVEQALQACAWTKEAGIGSAGYFMLGNPGETPETLEETYRFIQKVALDYIVLWYNTPMPGAPIWNEVEKWGTLKGWYADMSCMDILFVPYGVTEELMREYNKKIYRAFYLRPGRVMQEVARLTNREVRRNFFAGAKTILKGFVTREENGKAQGNGRAVRIPSQRPHIPVVRLETTACQGDGGQAALLQVPEVISTS